VLIRIVAFAIYLAATAAAADETAPCPSPMSGTVHSGRYDFEFQSWSWSDAASHRFSNCVRNNSATLPLFVSWAGLMGFVKESGGMSYVTIPASTDKTLKKQEPLWYGAGPQKLSVETIFPDTDALLDQDNNTGSLFRRVADPASADTSRAGEGSPLVSHAELYVPVAAFKPGATLAEIAATVEKSPKILRKFTMQFISRAELGADGGATMIVDRCEYQLDGTLQATSDIAIRIADDGLQRAMFKSSGPHNLAGDPGRRPGHWRFAFEGTEIAPGITPRQLAESRTRMELVTNRGDVVLASVPVAFYSGQRATR
jgi:hypothetical protein